MHKFFSYLVLLCAIAAYLFILMSSSLPSQTIMLVMQVAVISVGGWQILRLRNSKPSSWTSPVPPLVRILVILIALVGAISLEVSVEKIQPNLSPSGSVVTRFHWSMTNGECRVVYNSEGPVTRPEEECQRYDRNAGLGFSGAWLLFSGISVWFSYLGKNAINRIEIRG